MSTESTALAVGHNAHYIEARPAFGLWSPSIVPLDGNGAPDMTRLSHHVHWLLEHGCHGIALFGTTSEANSFSMSERKQVLSELLATGVEPDQLMIGTGCCAGGDTVDLTSHGLSLGVTRYLMLPPFYYKGVSDEGLFRSYAQVIDDVNNDDLLIYLYHFPRLSAVPISRDLVARLIKAYPDTVVGLKDSSGDWDNTATLLGDFPGFSVFPGSERFLKQGLQAGSVGCITASANANPAGIRAVYDAWRSGDSALNAVDDKSVAIRTVLDAYPTVPALKFLAAHYRGDPQLRQVRPPLVELDDHSGQRLLAALYSIGFSM